MVEGKWVWGNGERLIMMSEGEGKEEGLTEEDTEERKGGNG